MKFLKTKKLISMTFIGLLASMANAGGNTPRGGKISLLSIGTIVQVRLEDQNGNPISSDAAACNGDISTFVLLRDGNENFDHMYSGLLTGRALNAEVRLWLNGCHTMTTAAGVQITRATINGVNIF